MTVKKSVRQTFDLTGKVGIVTGGAGLLGEKHADVIAEFGGLPVLLDIADDAGRETANRVSAEYGISCEYVHCDITDESRVLEAKNDILGLHGRIDILINNAAVNPKMEGASGDIQSRLESLSIHQWNRELAVGLTGAMLCSKHFGVEIARHGGAILNVSSDLGIVAPDQRLYRKQGVSDRSQPVKPITYSVIKHGLLGLTKYLATYWAEKAVRVNSISPGGVFNQQDPEFVDRLTRLIPLRRMAEVDEYKAAVLFLISEASSYMTGANLVVDGGRTCW